MAWSPRQAAERDAGRLTLFFEQLEESAKARRGFHRFLGIANAHGRNEVTLAGISLGMPKQRRTQVGGSTGRPSRDGASEQQRGADSVRAPNHKQRRSAARAAANRAALAASANAASAPTPAAESPAPAPSTPSAYDGPPLPAQQPSPRERAGESSSRNKSLPQAQRRSLDELRELQQAEVIDLCSSEYARVSNATRTDIHDLIVDGEEAERRTVLRAAAREDGREPLSRGERAVVQLEWLWSFEDDWCARSAPGSHMETEWDGGAPT